MTPVYYYKGEIYHHGIKGMKWGVRRYQNKDGTLTEAGKKRLTSQITSRKSSVIDANKVAKSAITNDSHLNSWRESESYKNTLRAKSEYTTAKQRYLDVEDEVWRGVVDEIEKKHGRYEDLVNKNDKDGMAKFNKDYDKLLDKRFKETGVYELEREKDIKYEAYNKARKTFQEDTRRFVNDYLGDYGDTPLKGQGSAIYKARDIVDRVVVSDIFVEAFSDIDRIGRY